MLNILTFNAKEEIEIKNLFYSILILKSVSYSVLFSNLGRFHPNLGRFHSNLGRFHSNLGRFHPNLGRFFSKLLDGND